MAKEAGARAYCPPHLRKTVDTRHSLVLGVICSFEYELDATGNRLSVTDKSGKYTPYQYDQMQQLKAETRWSAKTPGTRSYQYAYAYDPNGNRIEEWHDGVRTTYTYGDNNEMLTAGGTSFTYDQFGNTLTNGAATYHWDDDSHLLSATGSMTLTDAFTYDGDSRRMSAAWNGSLVPVRFIYDELSSGYPPIIAEYTLNGSTFAIGAVYTHSLGLISSNRGGTKRYFHYDGLGSTHALTDSTGATTDTYTYSAFGVQESSTGSSVNSFRFAGLIGIYSDFARGSNYDLQLDGPYFRDSLTNLILNPFAGGGVLQTKQARHGLYTRAECFMLYDKWLEGCNSKLTACGAAIGISVTVLLACAAACGFPEPIVTKTICLICLAGAGITGIGGAVACLVAYNNCRNDAGAWLNRCLKKAGPPSLSSLQPLAVAVSF